jgi:hypothetical protein
MPDGMKGIRNRVPHLTTAPEEAGPYRVEFFKEFDIFTQHTYMIAYAASHLRDSDLDDVAQCIPGAVQSMLEEDDPQWNENLVGDSRRLRAALPSLSFTVLQLLLVRLDAMLHNLLDRLAKRNLSLDESDQSRSFEEDLQFVKAGNPNVYKWVVLLAELRNCIVHNAGVLNTSRYGRLRTAGWATAELEELSQRLPTNLTMSDVLKTKRSVRIVANMALEACGSAR